MDPADTRLAYQLGFREGALDGFDANDVPLPPFPPGAGPLLSFPADSPVYNLSQDFRPPAVSQAWQMKLVGMAAASVVTLQWRLQDGSLAGGRLSLLDQHSDSVLVEDMVATTSIVFSGTDQDLLVRYDSGNRPPVARDDACSMLQSAASLEIPFTELLANDYDPDAGDAIGVVRVSVPSLTPGSGGSTAYGATGVDTDRHVVTYTLPAELPDDWTGTVYFAYTIRDDDPTAPGEASAVVQLTVASEVLVKPTPGQLPVHPGSLFTVTCVLAYAPPLHSLSLSFALPRVGTGGDMSFWPFVGSYADDDDSAADPQTDTGAGPDGDWGTPDDTGIVVLDYGTAVPAPGTVLSFMVSMPTSATNAGLSVLADYRVTGSETEPLSQAMPELAVRAAYNVIFLPSDGGTVDGETVQLLEPGLLSSPVTAIPTSRDHFVRWTRDGSELSTANPLRVTGRASDMVVVAEFAPNRQEIAFAPLSSVTYGVSPFALTATASSGLPVEYSSSDPAVASVTGTTVTVRGAGTCTITDSQPGDGTWCPAEPVPRAFLVLPAPLTATADDQTMEYAGPVPTFTVSYSGLQGGDTVPAVPPTAFCDAAYGGPAGEYPINLTGGSDPNYTLTLVNGTLTIVDTVAPTAVAIRREAPAQAGTNAAEVTFAVTFSEPVVGLEAGSFVLDATGGQTAAVVLEAVPTGIDWKLVGAADVWSVRVQTGSGDGLLSLDLVNGLTAIHDSGGNVLQGPRTDGESFDVDHTPPALAAFNPATGADEVALAAPLLATFSEPVFAGTGSVTLLNVADGSVFETIAVTGGGLAIAGNTVSISHTGFVAGSWYAVTLEAGCLVDAKGNPFAGSADPAAWRFRARQWRVSFVAQAGGSIEGETEQRVDHLGSTTPVRAVQAYEQVFAGWVSVPDPLANPLTLCEVSSDRTVSASFRPASTAQPPGSFLAVVDAAAVLAGRGWWDLTGSHAMTVAGHPLVLEVVHDARGRLLGAATYTVAPGRTLTLPVRSNVKGSDGGATATIALRGANARAGLAADLRLVLSTSAAGPSLVGVANGRVTVDGNVTPVHAEAVALPLPSEAGTWTLLIEAGEDELGKVTGTALLTLAGGTSYAFDARGRFLGDAMVLSLAADPAEPQARGITIQATVAPLEAGWARLDSFSGRGYGQKVAW